MDTAGWGIALAEATRKDSKRIAHERPGSRRSAGLVRTREWASGGAALSLRVVGAHAGRAPRRPRHLSFLTA